MRRAHRFTSPRKRGSILIGLLWCLALLSVVVIGLLHTSRMDLIIGKNYSDHIQARYLALAGIEKAKALLYQDARERSRSGLNHNGKYYDASDVFRDITLGRGKFRVIRSRGKFSGEDAVCGVSDEESRLNLNNASTEELVKLEGMRPEIAAAIMDWRDADNEVTAGGAEADYYTSLQPPYLPRNGPFQTTRELLMVRGVSPRQLMGPDGWENFLTVNSLINNVNAHGDSRVNIQTADERELSGVKGITSDIAKAMVSYRGKNKFTSLADLLDVTAAQPQNNTSSGKGRSSGSPSSSSKGGGSGQKVISDTLLMEIADDLTVEAGQDLSGVVNINTAELEVLICLPGITRELARAIISHRQSSGFFPNIASLLKVPGLTKEVFKQVSPRITARSETYRILAEGKVTSTGARQRIQAIVHVGLNSVTTLSYREDDL